MAEGLVYYYSNSSNLAGNSHRGYVFVSWISRAPTDIHHLLPEATAINATIEQLEAII